jgi:hypothetical protein
MYVQALGSKQGCQMVYFQTKNPHLGKFWRVLQWKMLVYFVAIRPIFLPLGIFCGLLVYISRFGLLYQEKSGNPGSKILFWLDLLSFRFLVSTGQLLAGMAVNAKSLFN